MSSPLDLTANATDDGTREGSPSQNRHHDTKTRRGKRHVQDSLSTTHQESDVSAVVSPHTAVVNYLGNFVFVIIFNVIMLFFGAISRAFSLVFGNAYGTIFSSAEENELLRELPAEQRQQQRELENIHVNQLQQRQQLDDLRRRVQIIEERRKARGQASNETKGRKDN